MNKINDRDLTELSSYRVYQDINKDNDFTVNEKRFKQADVFEDLYLSLIHISEPTRLALISYAVFCLKKNFGAIKQSKHR
ncbi:hypothetical protein JMUB7540_28280 [Staphylococcus aureus]